eukprot:484983_1
MLCFGTLTNSSESTLIENVDGYHINADITKSYHNIKHIINACNQHKSHSNVWKWISMYRHSNIYRYLSIFDVYLDMALLFITKNEKNQEYIQLAMQKIIKTTYKSPNVHY